MAGTNWIGGSPKSPTAKNGPFLPAPKGVEDLPVESPVGDFLDRMLVGLAANTAEGPTGLYSMLDYGLRHILNKNQEVLPGADTATDITGRIDKSIRDNTSVAPPETTGERLTELLPSLLVPLPSPSKSKALKAGVDILAPFIPLRQAKTLAGTVVEGGIGAVAGEAVANQEGQSNIFDLFKPKKTLTDLIVGSGNEAAAATPNEGTNWIGPQEKNENGTNKDGWIEPSTPDEHISLNSDWIGGGGGFSTSSRLLYGGLAAVTALGLAGAGGAALSRIREAQRLDDSRLASAYGNKAHQRPRTTEGGEGQWVNIRGLGRGPITSQMAAQVVDNLQPLDSAIDEAVAQKHIRPEHGQALKDRIATSAHQAISTKINDYYKIGKLPDSTLGASRSIVDVLSDIQRFSPSDRGLFNDIRILGTQLDTMAAEIRQKNTPSAAHPTPPSIASLRNSVSWGGESYNQLQVKWRRARTARPDLVRLSDQLQEHFNLVPDYLHEMGMLTDAMRNKWKAQNPNYHPLTQEETSTWAQRLSDALFSSKIASQGNKGIGVEVESFLQRTPADRDTIALRPDEVGSAIYNTPQYFDDIIRYSQVNKARKEVTDVLSRVSMKYQGKRQPLLRVLSKPTREMLVRNAAVVKFYDQGVLKYVDSIDPGLLHSLRWSPLSVMPGVARLTNIATSFITGPYNPLFWMTKHPMYEGITAGFTLPDGRALGPFSRITSHIPGIHQLLTTPIASAEGVLASYLPVRQMYASMAENAHLMAEHALSRNSFMKAILGETNLKAASQIMKDAYLRSTKHLLESNGGVSTSRYSVHDYGTMMEALDKIPGFADAKHFNMRSSILYRMYMGYHDALREGVKMQFYGANTKRKLQVKRYTVTLGGRYFNMPIPVFEPVFHIPGDDLRLAAQTRALSGDMARHGGINATGHGLVYQQFASAIPYWNQTIQAGRAYARAFKDHPVRMLTGMATLTTSALAAWSYAASTPEGKKLIEEMTPEQRGRFLPILDGDGKLQFLSALPPELRAVISPAVEAWLGHIGAINSPEFEGAEDVARAAWDTMVNDIFPDVSSPPIARLIAGFFGKTFMEPNSLNVQDPMQDTVDRAMSPNEQASWRDRFQLMAQAITGSASAYFVSPLLDTLAAIDYKQKHPEDQSVDWPTIALDVPLNSLRYNTGDAKFQTVASLALDGKNKGSVANLTFDKLQASRRVLDNVVSIGAKTVQLGGSGFQLGRRNVGDSPLDFVPNDRSSEFAQIWDVARGMQSGLKGWQDKYSDLKAQQDLINRNVFMGFKDKMQLYNQIQGQKRELNTEMLKYVREMEQVISNRIGREFSFEGYEIPAM